MLLFKHPVVRFFKRGRVTVANANRLRLPLSMLALSRREAYRFKPRNNVSDVDLGGLYGELEDRRFWHPDGQEAPAASLVQPRHRLVYRGFSSSSGRSPSASSFFWPSFSVGFKQPSRVLICIRRRARREVMHALGFAGKVGQRPPHRGPYSSVRC